MKCLTYIKETITYYITKLWLDSKLYYLTIYMMDRFIYELNNYCNNKEEALNLVHKHRYRYISKKWMINNINNKFKL